MLYGLYYPTNFLSISFFIEFNKILMQSFSNLSFINIPSDDELDLE